MTTTNLDTEDIVRERYTQGARTREASLCCPVDYNPEYLRAIPEEVIAKDYGCGDPSRYLQPGETVLDLGSGTGKICFIASQVVGPTGRVIGVDMTDDMLTLARNAAPQVAEKIGYANVEFRKGRIQDLALDLEALDSALAESPLSSANSFLACESLVKTLRENQPLIRDGEIDVIVSNCVLNLVTQEAKKQLFSEMLRVLKNGGRAVISDIVCDEEVPAAMQQNPELWSGCISGAFTETGLLKAFEDAGFCGIRLLEFGSSPWQTVNGIEFRSVTVEAVKGKQGECFDCNQAVIYVGPFKEVLDDDGHRMERGKRYAMCAKTFALFNNPAYRDHFVMVEPAQAVPLETAPAWDYTRSALRHPSETKGGNVQAPVDTAIDCCAPASTNCCP